MTWFKDLTGFHETSPEDVRGCLSLDGEYLLSHINGRRWRCGRLEVPSLGALRTRTAGLGGRGRLTLRQVQADVRRLHVDPRSAGACFQVAAQFNLLEMIGPALTPEAGVGRYEDDPTQGPACAIAAGAGTIFRNYFVPLGDGRGQTAWRQIDTLTDVGALMGNVDDRLWTMRNGYALVEGPGLEAITLLLARQDEAGLDKLRSALRIGVPWDTEVTLDNAGHTVTQAFCSALPESYCYLPEEAWEPFARLVLEAAYEATQPPSASSPLAPPVALITAPTDGEVVSGNVTVMGTAAADGFSTYSLAFGAGATPTAFAMVDGSPSGNTVTGDVLGIWPTDPLAPGEYVLRLTVETNDGRTAEQSVRVVVGGGPVTWTPTTPITVTLTATTSPTITPSPAPPQAPSLWQRLFGGP